MQCATEKEAQRIGVNLAHLPITGLQGAVAYHILLCLSVPEEGSEVHEERDPWMGPVRHAAHLSRRDGH